MEIEKRVYAVHNALVMPLCGRLDAFTAGVFERGVCLPESLLYRFNVQSGCAATLPPWCLQPGDATDNAAPSAATQSMADGGAPQLFADGVPVTPLTPAAHGAAVPDELSGSYVFGGYLFRHFGHFLLESLSRLYAIQACAPVPIVFSGTHTEIQNWQHKALRLLGLRNEIVLVTHPVRVEKLIMATPGVVLDDLLDPCQVLALGQVTPPPLVRGRRIWLSRRLSLGGGLSNEQALEDELAALGWEIVHPQFLPLRVQVDMIGSAEYVAGFDGSAFHTALLARQVRGTFIMFYLRNGAGGVYAHTAKLKGYRLVEVPLQGKVCLVGGEAAAATFKMDDMNVVLDALREHAGC